jgi:hypothetical protein
MATVVSTGLVWGQSGVPSPSQAPDDPTGRVITVNEAGKPPQKCRVVKASVDEKGRKVLQVESLTTGEVMTIITEGPAVMGEPAAGHPRTLRTQIFHWGRDHTPPAAVCQSGCAPTTTVVSAPTCTTCPPDAKWAAPVVTNCDPCKPTKGGPVITTGPAITASGTPAVTVVNTKPVKEPKVAQAEPSMLDKWRESWGKADKPKAPEPKKEDVVKVSEPKKAPEPTRPVPPPDLPHVDTTPKKPDPLLSDPTQFVKKPLDEKLPKAAVPPTDLPKMPGAESLGAGSRSITDSGAVTNAPNPVAMMPANMGPAPRAPQPIWRVPQAPQPVNPGPGAALEANQGGIGYNAFTPYEYVPPAPGSAAQGMLGNAFSSDLDPRPAAGVFGPSGPPAMMMPPPGSGPMHAGLPPAPYGPVVRMPSAPGSANPMGKETQLAMLPPQRNTGVVQTGYQAPAAPASTGMGPQQLTGMLRDALYPSQREWAADKLSALDWKKNDAAVEALTKCVHDDPAPTVRAACIRALAKMKADSYAAVSAVQAAKKDADARVRAEAEQALGVLTPGATAPAPLPAAVQPASVLTPPAPAAPAPASGGAPALPALPN